MRERTRKVKREETHAAVEVVASYGEPQTSFDLFCVYLAMQRRSLRELADISQAEVGKSISFKQIGKYSRKWEWQARAKTFDLAARRLALDEVLASRSDELISLFSGELEILREALSKLSEAIQACEANDYKRLQSLLSSYRQWRFVVSELTAEQLQLWSVKIDEN